ncbi:MAG: PsbP-related protein [bacterium]|nr:PsbP-related protein [bacterium]
MPEEITTPSLNQETKPNSQKKLDVKKTLITVIVITIVVGLIGGAIFWYSWNMVNREDKGATIKQASSSAQKDGTTDWKTYTNTTAGYKISYPSTWTFVVETPKTRPEQEYTSDKFTGTEGEIRVDYGTGLGGGCGPTQEGQLSIKNSTLSVCVVNPDNAGGKTYNLLGAVSGEKEVTWRGFITVNKPVATNEEIVLKIVASIETTK